MNREEAKEIISRHHWAFASMDDEVIEAIECLAEDCEDAISRAAAIKEIQDRRLFKHVTKDGWFWLADEKVILNVLKGLPSVTSNQIDVLDKIRAEITAISINGQVDEHAMFIRTGEQVKQMALDIVDKHRAGKRGLNDRQRIFREHKMQGAGH